MRRFISLTTLLTLCGCTRIEHDPQVISQCVYERIGKEVVWRRCLDPSIVEWLDSAVAAPLTVECATQIALLNNPGIQAIYENIGIAQADLLQAGLFHNPVFNGNIRFPSRSTPSLNSEMSIMMNFLDIFFIPLRKKVALAELQQVELDVTHAVLDLSFEVERVYYALSSELWKYQRLEWITELMEASNEISEDQYQVGNIYIMTRKEKESEYRMAQLELDQSELTIARLRTELSRLLGFDAICWKIDCELPHELPCIAPVECLETLALEQRLDYRSSWWDVEKIARSGALKQWWAYTDAWAGASTELEVENLWETGPAFAVAIPIFDYGQADRARLWAELNQSRDQFCALRIHILNDVQQVHDRLNILRNMVEAYTCELLPTQEEIVNFAQMRYNVMTLGAFGLIDKKIHQYWTEIHYIMTLRDFWIEHTNLKAAIGGEL